MELKTKTYRVKADVFGEGQLEAVFSVFNTVDSDGDVVLPSAIKDGKEIPLVWSHDWTKPIGKGTIRNDGSKATFSGQFFLDTSWGQDAYNTVKAMGDLQEYSWGFRVLNQEKGEKDGKVVNFIKETEEFEVSPVLIGANRETGTVSVKQQQPQHQHKFYVDATADGSFEELKQELNRAFRERQFSDDMHMGWTDIVATYEDRFVAMMWRWDDTEDSYWEVSYSRTSSGEILLGDPKEVTPEIDFAPIGLTPTVTQAMSFDEHSDYVRIAVTGLLRRSKTGSELRRKEGRAISSARRTALETVVTSLSDAAKQIQELLDETQPTMDDDEKSSMVDGTELFAQFMRIESELNGVHFNGD